MTFRIFSVIALLTLWMTPSAHAFAGTTEQMDALADVIAIIVILVVPVGLIVVFWKLHVLPEKIAEKRHHPHADSIKVLCLLSLFVGGLLWPLAWLWAYTKPVGYKLAYGTDKSDTYFIEAGEKLSNNELSPEEIEHIRHELAKLHEKNPLNPRLTAILNAFNDSTIQSKEA
jgi:hypothetical protein